MEDQAPTPGSADIESARALVAEVPHWHHKFEIFPGVETPGSYSPEFMFDKLQLPGDMTGLRALDIGPSDGFFSMKMGRRGAQVTAIDYRAKSTHGFAVMERLTGLQFDYRQANLYDLASLELGTFDIVLFLGVLYHLPDMMRGLDLVARHCRKRLIVETKYDPNLMPGAAVARYYEAGTLANDLTNFWVPNKECLFAMLRDTGFRVDRHDNWGDRLLVDAALDDRRTSEKLKLAYGLLPE